MVLRMRVRNYVRWDFGEELSDLEHPLVATVFPIQSTYFALYFDRVWEWLTCFDKAGDIHVPHSERSNRRYWDARAREAVEFAGLVRDHYRTTGECSLFDPLTRDVWDKELVAPWVWEETLDWIATSELRVAVPPLLRFKGLCHGLARFGQLPEDVCDLVVCADRVAALSDQDAEVLWRWIDSHRLRSKYPEIRDRILAPVVVPTPTPRMR